MPEPHVAVLTREYPPEVYGGALAANVGLRAEVRRRVESGMATWAECGGMLWLCRSLDGTPQCGAIAADASMGGRVRVGYRRAPVRADNPVAAAGSELSGGVI